MISFRIIHFFIMTLNILCALLFIVASYSDIVSPNKFVFFSYLGLLFPFLFIINCCFLLYWLIVRKLTMCVIIICSFLICWKPITRYLPVHLSQFDNNGKNVIKVLTYNVMAFGYQDHTTAKPNAIIQYIANSDADIVCLQEYMIGTLPNFLTQEKIERALNMYPYHFTVPLIRKNRYTIGLAIYSKFPILNSRKILYNSTFNGSTIHELDVKGEKLYVINNHLESFKLTMEDLTKYEDFFKKRNLESFDELKGVVQKKLSTAFQIRAEQAEIVAEEIAKLDTDYLLVCGDFNDTPVSYTYQIVKGPMVDAFAKSGTGLGITYNKNFFWLRIDHILHSPNMKAYNAKVDDFAKSDHYPMWCYLEMK